MNNRLLRVITQSTNLLICGETGTGKSRLARHIHELSPRRDHPLQVVDCATLAPTLIESEIFGHVRGAFTGADLDRAGKFETVGEGTLLLDEINALPIALQGKLLRVLDDRRFERVGSNVLVPLNARLIVISSSPLEEEVAAGRMRADLYYRLNVVSFHLPPLRQVPDAILPLAQDFVTDFVRQTGRHQRSISRDAQKLLSNYPWPGNVRELRNAMERAVNLGLQSEIQVHDLPEPVRSWRPPKQSPSTSCPPAVRLPRARPADVMTLSHDMEQVEILKITEVLRKHRNNRVRAAAELGISRMSLYNKLRKYGMF